MSDVLAEIDEEQRAELEAHRQRMHVLMQEAIAPLLARLDAAEAALIEERKRGEDLDKERLAEARARYRASVLTQLVAGQLASNTFNWDNEVWELGDLRRLADRILDTEGLL